MNLMRLQKYYLTFLPLMVVYPTIVGLDTGISANKINPTNSSINKYSNMIGYTCIGIITGLTYPISYPLCGSYVLYKNHT